MHIIHGPAAGLNEDNESFPFQNDILGYVYMHGNDRVTKRYVISGHASRLPCGFLSTVGEV